MVPCFVDPVPDLWTNYSSIEERIEAFLTTTPEAPPNTEYVYSDINVSATHFFERRGLFCAYTVTSS